MASTETSSIFKKKSSWMLIIGSLGVIYGDIGTSPLYAIRELFFSESRLPLTFLNIVGAISLVFWIMTIIVTLEYILFVLVADHDGQGGVFALLNLLTEHKKKFGVGFLIGLLVLAAGLLFGSGTITPAISILSAVEGLSIATSIFNPYIIPITIAILTILFAFQYKGTNNVGAIFGPVMIIWFIVIGLLGLHQIILQPAILHALNPYFAFHILFSLPIKNLFYVFGAVVLVVAGVEALYTDLGHFGLGPIRISWVSFVYPALILTYLGQGAYLLSGNPILNNNIFYSMVPKFVLFPMVILATLAAVIASQALISGAYSLIAQAVALNYVPRFKIIHTNKKKEGQIYVPAVNWLLYTGAVLLVLYFKTSTGLAAAYGLAASGTMLTTSITMFAVAVLYWRWPWWKSLLVFSLFTLVDLMFFVTNSLRFFEGGYVPIILGIILFIIMINWNWGRRTLHQALDNYAGSRTIDHLVDLKTKLNEGSGVINDKRGQFVEAGRAVIFLVDKPIKELTDNIPVLVRAYMRQNGALPKYTIMLTIDRTKSAYMRRGKYFVTNFGHNIYAAEARFGFMEDITLAHIAEIISDEIPILKEEHYMVEAGSEEVRLGQPTTFITRLKIRLFRILQRFAAPTYRYFGINSSASLTTTSLTVYMTNDGGEVKLPELDLDA